MQGRLGHLTGSRLPRPVLGPAALAAALGHEGATPLGSYQKHSKPWLGSTEGQCDWGEVSTAAGRGSRGARTSVPGAGLSRAFLLSCLSCPVRASSG